MFVIIIFCFVVLCGYDFVILFILEFGVGVFLVMIWLYFVKFLLNLWLFNVLYLIFIVLNVLMVGLFWRSFELVGFVLIILLVWILMFLLLGLVCLKFFWVLFI